MITGGLLYHNGTLNSRRNAIKMFERAQRHRATPTPSQANF